jgi:hypothetical protein
VLRACFGAAKALPVTGKPTVFGVQVTHRAAQGDATVSQMR